MLLRREEGRSIVIGPDTRIPLGNCSGKGRPMIGGEKGSSKESHYLQNTHTGAGESKIRRIR
jgi:hypothetical protein